MRIGIVLVLVVCIGTAYLLARVSVLAVELEYCGDQEPNNNRARVICRRLKTT